MSRMSPLIEAYLAGPKKLRDAVAGMSREQLLAHPVPGKMSALEVVAHLTDFEPVYADRCKRVIAEDRPSLIGADQDRFREALRYQDRDVEEELTIVEATRAQLARILRKLPESALDRVGIHNERGPLTLADLLGYAIGHIDHHAPFIHEKRKALGMK